MKYIGLKKPLIFTGITTNIWIISSIIIIAATIIVIYSLNWSFFDSTWNLYFKNLVDVKNNIKKISTTAKIQPDK